MNDLKKYLAKFPHHVRDIEGGKIAFFCLKRRKKMFVCCPDPDCADIAEFYRIAGKHPEVEEVERDFSAIQPKGLCESIDWGGDYSHAQCQECEKRRIK